MKINIFWISIALYANMFSQKWILNFVCCDRRENLYCNKCAHISNVGYSFLSSSKAENVL